MSVLILAMNYRDAKAYADANEITRYVILSDVHTLRRFDPQRVKIKLTSSAHRHPNFATIYKAASSKGFDI